MDCTNHWRAYRHAYAVTCRHVVEGGADAIRVNTEDGGSRFIECDPLEWQFHDEADLAAIDITDALRSDDEVALLPLEWLMSPEYISHRQIDVGEDGFMLGLFAEEPGKKSNMIAARFGNLSMLSSEDGPIRRRNGTRLSAHVFDMRSRTGFSGSPVFVYRTPGGDIRSIEFPERRDKFNLFDGGQLENFKYNLHISENSLIAVLGVHIGQYRDRVSIEKSRSLSDEINDPVTELDKLLIPNSLALVEPAWRVHELLEKTVNLIKQRKEREKEDVLSGRPQLVLEYSIYHVSRE